MKILAIETSCDETAVSILEADGSIDNLQFEILSDTLFSQIDIHKEYGGVFPMLAKRAHAQNLVPLTKKALHDAQELSDNELEINQELEKKLSELLEREPDLYKDLIKNLKIEKPGIDLIAVTSGPGLEPALWVGINFAKALSEIWNIPIMPINHMEGHIVSSLLNEDNNISKAEFPALALLISGGHTELVLIKDWLQYEIIGETQDDAVGEAYDKVARMLDLPYPGGPEISKLAEQARQKNLPKDFTLPRPMIHTEDYHFSFSGLKTAVLYLVKELGEMHHETKEKIAREFEDSVSEIFITKTKKALEEYGAKTLIIGGGVSANKHLRKKLTEMMTNSPETALYIPSPKLSTDNAIMIGVAAYIRSLHQKNSASKNEIHAKGNLKLA